MNVSNFKHVPIGFILNRFGVVIPNCIDYYDTLETIRSDENKFYSFLNVLSERLSG